MALSVSEYFEGNAGTFDRLYDDDSEILSNAIDVHVASLRKKLGAGVIETRRGHGYLIDA